MELLQSPQAATKTLYSLIPLRPWQTRLLRLDPVDNSDKATVTGDLVVADITYLDGAVLHDGLLHVDYVALSYTWGAGPYSKRVMLNGENVYIKENLFNFLLRYRGLVRDGKCEPYIWIDALCINQAHNAEKSQQVSSMLVFYEHAKEVLVWLGEATNNTDAAMDFLLQNQSHNSDLDRLSHLHSNVDIGRGLHELYSKPWATRIWVKQEVWAAKHITVHCGQRAVSWDSFRRAFPQLNEDNSNDEEDLHDNNVWFSAKQETWLQNEVWTSNVRALLRLKRPPKEGIILKNRPTVRGTQGMQNRRQDILHLLQDARYCESTDVRDRIFALLGMCNDPGIKVNYAADATEVFTSLARHLMEREGRVSVALALNSAFGASNDLVLPSWVPDWRSLDPNAMDSAWELAFHIDPKTTKRHLELETVVLLPPESRGPTTRAWRKSHRTFIPNAPKALHLRGYVIAILPQDVGTNDEQLRLSWNPLATPIVFNSATDDKRFREWQQSVKLEALGVLNGETKRHHQRSIAYRDCYDRDARSWRDIIELLGFPSSRYVSAQSGQATYTLADLQELGDAAFQIFPARRDVQLEKGDLLVSCHGIYLPVALRPIGGKEDAHFTFVGVVQCHEVYRLSRPSESRETVRIDEEFRIVLHAREGLGGIETFAVV